MENSPRKSRKIKKSESLSPRKARRILHEGVAQGKPLTEQQRKFFGARASGYPVKKVEGGSTMASGGFVSKGEMVWNKLTASKRAEFLYENFTPEITPRSQEILVDKAYNFLPKNVKIKIEAKYANVEEGQYENGGSMATGGEMPTWKYTSGMEWSPNQVLELFVEKAKQKYGKALDHEDKVALMTEAKEQKDGMDMDNIYRILEDYFPNEESSGDSKATGGGVDGENGNWFKEGSDKWGLEKSETYIKENNGVYDVFTRTFSGKKDKWVWLTHTFPTLDEAKKYRYEDGIYAKGGSTMATGGKIEKVKNLLRKNKVNPDDVSPNFVNEFANKHGINLTSDEVVKISNTYSFGGSMANGGGMDKELPNKVFLFIDEKAKKPEQHWFHKKDNRYETITFLSGNKYKKSFDEVRTQLKKSSMATGGGAEDELSNVFYVVVDKDERGEYGATVYNSKDKEVWDIDTEGVRELQEDGSIKYKPHEDLERLGKYLASIGKIPAHTNILTEDYYNNLRGGSMKTGGVALGKIGDLVSEYGTNYAPYPKYRVYKYDNNKFIIMVKPTGYPESQLGNKIYTSKSEADAKAERMAKKMSDKDFEVKAMATGGGVEGDERYKVVKVSRKSDRRKTIKDNLTLDEARELVNSYPNSDTSMVVFTKMYATGGGTRNGGSPEKKDEIDRLEKELKEKGVVFTFWDDNGIGVNSEYKGGAIEEYNYATDDGVERLPDDIIKLIDDYNDAVDEYYNSTPATVENGTSNITTLDSFVQGNEKLSEEKDEIYKMAVSLDWSPERIHQQFKRIFSYMSEISYNKENPDSRIEMTEEERNEFASLYADKFNEWKSQKNINTESMPSSSKSNVNRALQNLNDANEKLNEAEAHADKAEDNVDGAKADVEHAVDDLKGNPLPFKDAGKISKQYTGGIKNQYKGMSPEQVWRSWTPKQRMDFLEDHDKEINRRWKNEGNANTELNADKWYASIYSELPLAITDSILNHVQEGQYAEGSTVKSTSNMTKDKQKLAEKITKIERALASDKLSDKARASMEQKLAKYKSNVSRRIPVYERILNSKGKFYIEIPSEYRLKMNTLLHGTNLKPRYNSLGDKLRITVDNKAKLNRLYKIYSDMLTKKSKPVPRLEEISGKPQRVRPQ